MIERYTLPEMGAIWSEQNKFDKWLEFELLVCDGLAELGEIPDDAVKLAVAVAQLVKAIVGAGEDPVKEIRRLSRSYDAKRDARDQWEDALNEAFPDDD